MVATAGTVRASNTVFQVQVRGAEVTFSDRSLFRPAIIFVLALMLHVSGFDLLDQGQYPRAVRHR